MEQRDDLTKYQKKYLQRLIDISKDGVAPNSTNHSALASSLCYHFGSWANAIKAAGLRSNVPTDEELLEELRRRSKNGVAPRSKDDRKFGNVVARRFGSWREAVERAGLTPRPGGSNPFYTKEDCLKELMRRSIDGVAPKTTDDPSFAAIVHRHYGSWKRAAKAAGLKTQRNKRMAREALIEELKSRADGKYAPSSMEDVSFTSSVVYHFGSWSKGIKAAGLKSCKHKKVSPTMETEGMRLLISLLAVAIDSKIDPDIDSLLKAIWKGDVHARDLESIMII